jgi:hypothetical protein
MNLTDLIAEARAVRAYLFAPESTSISQAALARFDASKRVDRVIDTLERLAVSLQVVECEPVVAPVPQVLSEHICGTFVRTGCEAEITCHTCCCCVRHCECNESTYAAIEALQAGRMGGGA